MMIDQIFFRMVMTACCVVFSCQMVCQAASLSTNELLGYSLDSLRSKMDTAVQETQKLSAKNSSIRKRILFLKKEMRELDDEMIGFKEQSVGVKNNIKMSAEEVKIDEKRLNNVLEQNRYLSFERDTLKKQIETLALEQDMMEEEAEEVSFDIQSMEGNVGAPVSSNLLDYYNEEKLKFVGMVQDYRKRTDDKRDKIDLVDLEISGKLRFKERALREQESLGRTVADWELRLKEEEARTALLNKGMQRWQEATKNQRKVFEDKSKEQRKYLKELVKTIEDFKVIRQDLEGQFKRDEKDMNRYGGLLKEENEKLYKYQKATEAGVVLVQKKGDQEHNVLVLTDEQREIKKAKSGVRIEISQLQDELTRQQQENKSLERDQSRLQEDLNALMVQVEEAKHSVAVVREDAFGLKRKELENAMKEQHLRIKSFEDKIEKVDADKLVFNDQVVFGREQAKQLQQEIDLSERASKEISNQKEELMLQQEKFSALAQKNAVGFKREIADIQMRKQALVVSLDVVHKKYEAGEGNAQEFNDEKAELLRYLDVLKKENMGLRKKLSGLENK